MEYFKTLGGKEFNPRDLISFLKTKYISDPRKYDQKGAFAQAGNAVRSAFGVTDYASTQELDPTFDYNKYDWGDVYKTISGWATGGDPKLQALATTLSPYLEGSQNDAGIYKAGDLQNEITNITNMGTIKADEAKWQAVFDGDGSANTIAFLKQNQIDSISSLNEQASLLKQQLQATSTAGREQINADYSGVTAEILAGVRSLQSMTTDEYAARGMAFSGTLNRANADIAVAGATEIAKAMAQKGAKLGAIVQDLIKYTAQIDIDTLRGKTDLVAQYGLQMASLLDKDASVRNEAKAMLAALSVQEQTQNEVAPLQNELTRTQTTSEYDAATVKAQQAADQKIYDRKMAANQLLAQYGLIIDPETGDFAGQSLTPIQKWNIAHDAASLLGLYGIQVSQDANGNYTFTDGQSDGEKAAAMNAQASLNRSQADVTNANKGAATGTMTVSQANGYIKQYTDLKAQLAKYSQDKNGNWVIRGEMNPAYTAGVAGAPMTIDKPVDAAIITNLQNSLAALEDTYRKAIVTRNTANGVPTDYASLLSTEEQDDFSAFRQLVMAKIPNPSAAEGVGAGTLTAIVESFLQGTLDDGSPVLQSLTPETVEAIRAWAKNGGG